VGQALVDDWLDQWQLLALAVVPTHVHALMELPADGAAARRVVGDGKRAASRAIRAERPGRVWAAGAALKVIVDGQHQAATFDYICHQQGPTAWVWSFREGVIQRPGGGCTASGSA
jgi:REP element-mobilizing transposase RayT